MRTERCTGRPRAANALRVGEEKTDRCSWMLGSSEKPLEVANALRSRTWSPTATAGRFSTWEFFDVIIPKGRLEREKWLSGGMGSQDLRGAIVSALVLLYDSPNLVDRQIVDGLENALSIKYLKRKILWKF